MKERDFINQNNVRWQEFESEIKKAKADPRTTTKSYIEMMDDLSYSRTHYPNRLVRSYLNGVAQILSVVIYRSQKSTLKNLRSFWLEDLPLVMFHSRKHLLLSFLLFAGSMGIGVFSCIQDPNFAQQILGESYVNMTIENIEKGDPMAVYKDEDATSMFLGITQNNILVSVRTYVLSFFFGVGTIVILLYNGVMVGVFQYFFVERGLFWESFLTIWQHGTIEISSIILAGAAGFVLSDGVFFPGSYSRLDGLRIAARKSVMIAIGIVPLFVIAGLLESFVTRLTDLHWLLRLGNILVCFSFIVYYFVLYPIKVARSAKIENKLRMNTLPIQVENFDPKKVYGVANTYAQAILLILQNLKTVIFGVLFISVTAAIALIKYDSILENTTRNAYQAYSVFDMIMFNLNFVVFGLLAFLLCGAAFIAARISAKAVGHQFSFGISFQKFFAWAAVFGILTSFILSSGYSLILAFFVIPLLLIMLTESMVEKRNIFAQLVPAYQSLKIGIWRFLATGLVTFLGVVAVNIIHSQLTGKLLKQATTMLIPLEGDLQIEVPLIIETAGLFIGISTLMLVWFIAIIYNHLSVKEAYQSRELRDKVESHFDWKEFNDNTNFSNIKYHKN